MGSEIHKRDLVGAGFDEPKLVAYCLRPIACGLLLVAYCLWPIERQPFRCLELRAFSMIGEPRSRRQRFAGGLASRHRSYGSRIQGIMDRGSFIFHVEHGWRQRLRLPLHVCLWALGRRMPPYAR